MRQRELKKIVEPYVKGIKSFAEWYGKPFSELSFDRVKGLCRVSIVGRNTCRYVLTCETDGYISFGKRHRRLELEEWSRLYGVFLVMVDVESLDWVVKEGLIIIKYSGRYLGVDLGDDGEIIDIMEKVG